MRVGRNAQSRALHKLLNPPPAPAPAPTDTARDSIQPDQSPVQNPSTPQNASPLRSQPSPTTTPEDAAIVSRIEARRAPRPLQALDLTLLHAPPVADGWNSFLGAVRTQTTIGADVRELAISRVAVVNKAWYEWGHHAPLAVKAGVPTAGMDAIKTEAPLELSARPEVLSEQQWAVLVYADEMTRNVRVKDETFAVLKGLFNEREVVEITTTVACYNCVSRFLVALDVGERNSTGPDDVELPSH